MAVCWRIRDDDPAYEYTYRVEWSEEQLAYVSSCVEYPEVGPVPAADGEEGLRWLIHLVSERVKSDGDACFVSMFVRQVWQCFSAVWADGFPQVWQYLVVGRRFACLYIPELQFVLVSAGCRWPKAREGKEHGDTDAHGAGYQET